MNTNKGIDNPQESQAAKDFEQANKAVDNNAAEAMPEQKEQKTDLSGNEDFPELRKANTGNTDKESIAREIKQTGSVPAEKVEQNAGQQSSVQDAGETD